MVEVLVPLAIMVVGLALIIEVISDATIGTDPHIDKLGVPVQLNVEIKEEALTPSPILPAIL
jgi:hypothetical protein